MKRERTLKWWIRWLFASIVIAWVLTIASAIVMVPFTGGESPADGDFSLERMLMAIYFVLGAVVSYRFLR